MRNKIYFFLTLFIVLCKGQMSAQCPPTGFSISDTVCPGQSLIINNASSSAVQFQWDFCPGDLDSVPTASAAASISGTLTYPQNMKMVEVDGNYYGFFANALANYVTRYDFGNSPANIPVAVNLSTDPLLVSTQSGIDVVKEGNKWLVFVTMYGNNTLTRLEMDSITQVTPVFSSLAISGLASPTSIKIIDGYAFVPNNQSPEIIRLDFNGSYLNTPVVMSPAINTGAFNNYGIDIDYDCSTGQYTGFSTSYGFGNLYRLEFGNSLANSPTLSTAGTGLWGAQGIDVVKEKGDWHLFMTSNTNTMTHFRMGNSLSNLPVQDYSSNFGGIMADPKNIQMVKSGSTWYGISSNTGLFSFVRFTFPQGCLSGAMYSGLQSPSGISYGAGISGMQFVELTETYAGGASLQFTDSVLVSILPPLASFVHTAACDNGPIAFSDQSSVCSGSITNWSWDFGDGNTAATANPVHSYQAAGTFTVTLTVTSSDGLSDTYVQNVVVNPAPVAWFGLPASACAGADVLVSDSSQAGSGVLNAWSYSFGDGDSASTASIPHAWLQPGSYDVTLIAYTDIGCSDTSTRNIQILPGPFASFETANTCIGETVDFTNTSVSPGTTIQSYAWDFGDGNTASTQQASHNYAMVPGQYNVSLVCAALNGCADTLIREIKIGNKPSPFFTVSEDTVCSFSTLSFNDGSSPAAGDTIFRRIWDFGDGNTDSNTVSPIHAYTQPGLYTVTLTVYSPTDCDSSFSLNVFIIESPVAAFTVNNACFGDAHNFNDLSTAPAGSVIDSWHWYFGNGDSSLQPSVVYTYPDTGNYSVTLIIRSNIGCYDTLSLPATVYKIPVANFSVPAICTNQPVTFNDSSSVEGSVLTQWQWDFGGTGNTSSLQHPVTSFPSALAYAVTLIATSQQGCSDTVIKMVAADQSPEFTISSPDHCEGISQQMISTVTSGSTTSLSYLWNFGDNTASFLSNPSHLYTTFGQYVVSLLVSDLTNGCELTISDTVTVHENPVALFGTGKLCEKEPVTFTDSSLAGSGIITGWNWSLGTAGVSTLSSPSAIYNSPGSQSISLTVTSVFGCRDSVSKLIQIHPTPKAAFSLSPPYGAPPLPVNFNNQSDSGSYTWDFGDGSPLYSGNAPQHTYTDTGVYTITLTVMSGEGCLSQYDKEVFVLIPERDLAVNGISYIRSGGKWIMKAIVANYGNEDAYTFQLKAQLNNLAVFYNTFNADTLSAGSLREYIFNTQFDAGNGDSPDFFCVEVVSVNNQPDVNPANNRFCATGLSGFEVISVYPNPGQGTLYLGIHLDKAAEVQLSLYQSDGKLIRDRQSYFLEKGLNTITENTESLEGGVYLLQIASGENTRLIKLFRQ